MLCECSWYVLNILMVLFIMALKQKRYQRPTEKVFKVIPFQTCQPVQYLELVSWGIDQLATTLRQWGVLTPLLRIDLNAFYNAGALVMGKILLCCYCDLSKSVHRSEYELNYDSRQSILGEGYQRSKLIREECELKDLIKTLRQRALLTLSYDKSSRVLSIYMPKCKDDGKINMLSDRDCS